MQNVYYWYDGCMPYCTDATAWQPLDDTFLYTSMSGYSYVDKSQGVAHPVSGGWSSRTPLANLLPE